ncbi:MAG: hypothetical protein DMF88_03865 [Acidobacteria bacterium]|nr:MAG: hypothetical protein DMF88_03865 [Acidobacteriota bacterium]
MNTARVATASAPRPLLGVLPSAASATTAVLAASCVTLSRVMPIVAPRPAAIVRAKSSAAPRVAPTIVTG